MAGTEDLDADDRVRARRADDALQASGLSLGAWVASLVADEAARARARTAWLHRQAADEGTFTGVLVDLAERGRPLVLHLQNGRRHRGALTLVGRDFCAVRTGTGREVLVAHRALASVRTLPGEVVTVGDRSVVGDLTFAEALAALAEHRMRVLVVGDDPGDAVGGELRSVGADLVTVRLDGAGGTAYVAIRSVLELTAGVAV